MTWLNCYKGVGKGKNLYEAIYYKSDSRGNPRIIEDWIDEQAKAYLSEEYDFDRICDLVWDARDTVLIEFFIRMKINLSSHCGQFHKKMIDRNTLIEFMKYAKTEEIGSLKSLQITFNEDMNSKRRGWAYERASEDYDIFIQDINTEKDEEVAVFFGVKAEVESLYDDESGAEIDYSDAEFCIACGEPTDKQFTREKILENLSYDDSVKIPEDRFLCAQCGANYPYNDEHCKLNKHLPKDYLIVKMI